MEKLFKILAINPGSTSTKIAVYQDKEEIFEVHGRRKLLCVPDLFIMGMT